jgi:SAM-dependent methyltransferase
MSRFNLILIVLNTYISRFMNKILVGIRRAVNIKFKHINKVFGNKSFNLLDVGAGNQSASKTVSIFPNCNYYGLDLDKSTNYIEEDFSKMKHFYQIDLTKLEFSEIPDNFFDYINMAHVIEHLHNGDKVIPLLLNKLKPNGYFYIEYPGAKSLRLPSMYGTLNFKDDPTHVRVYSIIELGGIFQNNKCEVISSGFRRNWYYIFAMPLRIIISLAKLEKIKGNIFWDLLGFAEYLFVRKV